MAVARRSGQRALTAPQAKTRVLGLIKNGATVREAMASVDRAVTTYNDWRDKDEEFKSEIDHYRNIKVNARKRATGNDPLLVPDFEEFCSLYLSQPLFPHQLRWYDILEGREPRDLHPTMVYYKGRENFVMFHVPPNHAKSTTITVNYVTWRINKDPNIRIVIVSKSQTMAKKFLSAIKTRLTNPTYRDMHEAFGPEGGWKPDRADDASWTATEIYVNGRESGEKDPTVQAIGVGGQIYGARADLIILDDVQDLKNVGLTETHFEWFGQEVATRPDESGMILFVGTRVASIDLGSKMRDEMRDEGDYPDDYEGEMDDDEELPDTPVWTYLAQPAVLEYAKRPSGWEVLWPERMPGRALAKLRNTISSASRWARAYQQQDVVDDTTFPLWAINASINRRRAQGPLLNKPGGRDNGMTGIYVIGGVDPATVGHTAILVMGVERATGRRYVLDGFNKAGTSPALLRQTIKDFQVKYSVNEWVIERNAFQRFLTQDEELRRFVTSHGGRIREHYTTGNKWDEEFGVAAMAPLFLSWGDEQDGEVVLSQEPGMIELPDPRLALFCGALVEQLAVWHPTGNKQSQLTDLVMALWFCEIAAKEIVANSSRRSNWISNPFAPKGDRRKRKVVNLLDIREAQLAAIG